MTETSNMIIYDAYVLLVETEKIVTNIEINPSIEEYVDSDILLNCKNNIRIIRENVNDKLINDRLDELNNKINLLGLKLQINKTLHNVYSLNETTIKNKQNAQNYSNYLMYGGIAVVISSILYMWFRINK